MICANCIRAEAGLSAGPCFCPPTSIDWNQWNGREFDDKLFEEIEKAIHAYLYAGLKQDVATNAAVISRTLTGMFRFIIHPRSVRLKRGWE